MTALNNSELDRLDGTKRFYFKAVWSPHDELSASRFSRPTVDCPGMGAASDSGDVTVK